MPHPKPTIFTSQKAVAEHLGVHHVTVRKWRQEGMPGERGRYVIGEVEQWLRLQKPGSKGIPDSLTADMMGVGIDHALRKVADQDPRLRKQLAEADKLEEEARKLKRQNDEAEGQLLRRDDVEQAAAELCVRIRDRLEAIVDEVAMLIPEEVRNTVIDEIGHKLHLTLKEMSQWEPFEERAVSLDV
jgi:hypothetical protein